MSLQIHGNNRFHFSKDSVRHYSFLLVQLDSSVIKPCLVFGNYRSEGWLPELLQSCRQVLQGDSVGNIRTNELLKDVISTHESDEVLEIHQTVAHSVSDCQYLGDVLRVDFVFYVVGNREDVLSLDLVATLVGADSCVVREHVEEVSLAEHGLELIECHQLIG